MINTLTTIEKLKSSLATAHSLGNKLLQAPGATAASAYCEAAGAAIATAGALALLQGNIPKGATLVAAGASGLAAGTAGFHEILSEPDRAAAALQCSAAISSGLAEMGKLQQIHKGSLADIAQTGAEIRASSQSLSTTIERIQALLTDPRLCGTEDRAALSAIETRFGSLREELERKLKALSHTHALGSVALVITKLKLSQLSRKETLSERDLASLTSMSDPLTAYFVQMDESVKNSLALFADFQKLHEELSTLSSQILTKQSALIKELTQVTAEQKESSESLVEKNTDLEAKIATAQAGFKEMEGLNQKLQTQHQELHGFLEKLLKQLSSMKVALTVTVGVSALVISGILFSRSGRMLATVPLTGLVAGGVILTIHKHPKQLPPLVS